MSQYFTMGDKFIILGDHHGDQVIPMNDQRSFINYVPHVVVSQESPEVTITFDGHRAQLVIEEVTLDNKGTYEITAVNEGGKETSRATLFVEGKNHACDCRIKMKQMYTFDTIWVPCIFVLRGNCIQTKIEHVLCTQNYQHFLAK